MTDEEQPKSADASNPAPLKDKDALPDNEFMGRIKKPKLSASKKKAAKSEMDQQIEEAISKTSLQSKQKEKRKLQIRGAIALVILMFPGYLLWWMMTPYYGGVPYGICKTFIETRLRFPSYLRVSTVEEFETSVRIWYTQVDAFGQYRMEPAQCYFKQNPNGKGSIVDKVLVNRREIDPKIVADFNRSLPVVLKSSLDLALPDPLPDSLGDLQFNTDMFRKPIL